MYQLTLHKLILIKKIDINMSLPDSLFTTTSLSRERKLPRVK